MSEQPDSPFIPQRAVPQWDVADRMRKALREAGISVQEMALYLDVSRNTVSTWINGRIRPSKQTQRLWALRCGISYEWLCHGDSQPCGGRGKPVSPGQRPVITGRYSLSPRPATSVPRILTAA